jgi:pimeloyl-ACP methyl ester carboxylesterase
VLVVAGFFSGAPKGRSPVMRAILRVPGLGQLAFRARLRWCLGREDRLAAELATMLPADATRPVLTAALHDDLRRSDPATIAALARWLCDADFATEFAGITVPVLVLVCAHDTVVPPAHQIALLQGLAHGQAAIFASGHLPMVETPVAFNRFLQSWFRQTRPMPAGANRRQGTG